MHTWLQHKSFHSSSCRETIFLMLHAIIWRILSWDMQVIVITFLFLFVASSAKCLKILIMRGSNVTDQMVIRHAESLSNLTHLDVSFCLNISSKGLEAFGKHCKSLIQLKRDMAPPSLGMSIQEEAAMVDESEAMVIANTMSKLEHLEITYGRFTNRGINSVLDKCKALSHLDIYGCWGVWPDEALEKKCEELAFFLSSWGDDDIESQ